MQPTPFVTVPASKSNPLPSNMFKLVSDAKLNCSFFVVSCELLFISLLTFQFIFAAILAVCYAAPEPEPKAKPGFLAAGYSAPLVAPAAPAVAYPAAYAAPAAYAYAPYPYAAYAPYSAPLVLG